MKLSASHLLLTLLLASGSACAAAVCERVNETPRCHVNFEDLDLKRESGAAVLYSRIHSAARQVCEPQQVSMPMESLVRTNQCVNQSIARAVADVNAPTLTNYYLIKSR